MKTVWGWVAVLAALGGLSVAEVAAQTVGPNGVVYLPSVDGRPGQVLYSASHALVVGVSRYRDPYWPTLGGVPEDVAEVSKALAQSGFQVKPVVLNPDSRKLKEVLSSFMANEGQIKNARILIYFAGHGYTVLSETSGRTEGYVVPADAPNPGQQGEFKAKSLGMAELKNLATQMEAKHALFVFDSCFAGTIFTSKSAQDVSARIADIANKPVRVFITSGDADQKVPDDGDFRRYFVNALRDGIGQSKDDRFFTGVELGLYLHRKVTSLRDGSKYPQSPRVGKINDPAWDNGDFVFVSPKAPPLPPPPPPIDAEKQAWEAAQKLNNSGAYQAYLSQYPQGKFAPAARVMVAGLSPAPTPVPVSAPVPPAPRPAPMPTPTPAPAPAVPVQGQMVQECVSGVCFEMVGIPTGTFQMGSPDSERGRDSADEGPVHTVNVKGFWMGKTEVTQGLWKAVMGSNPSKFSSCGDNCPVEQVSWDDAQEFIKKLNGLTGKKYRLPSEAEWEYAARAGTKNRWSFVDQEYQLGEYAWYTVNSDSKTHPVGQKKPNPWGLHDMYGNVWEWLQDAWVDNYNGAPPDGGAREGNSGVARVLRGGSWSNFPQDLRPAIRISFTPVVRIYNFGFRLARTN